MNNPSQAECRDRGRQATNQHPPTTWIGGREIIVRTFPGAWILGGDITYLLYVSILLLLLLLLHLHAHLPQSMLISGKVVRISPVQHNLLSLRKLRTRNKEKLHRRPPYHPQPLPLYTAKEYGSCGWPDGIWEKLVRTTLDQMNGLLLLNWKIKRLLKKFFPSEFVSQRRISPWRGNSCG